MYGDRDAHGNPVNIDSRLSDRLRSEFGITEEALKGNSFPGDIIGTTAEIRSLRTVLRLNSKQFCARFRIPLGTLHLWQTQSDPSPCRLRPEAYALLAPVIARARELKALVPVARRVTQSHKGPLSATAERSRMVSTRCAGCGESVRRKDVREEPAGSREFHHGDPPCGPVQFEDRRTAKP